MKNQTMFLKVYSKSEWLEGFRYAALPLTKEIAETVLARRKRFVQANQKGDDLYQMVYWDTLVEYHDSDLEDNIHQIQDGFETGDSFMRPEGYDESVDTQERIECSRMCVTDSGVFWTAYPKHTDTEVETCEVPYSVFEALL